MNSTDGSGGGCSTAESRPSWQTGVTAASCSGRAIPDVAADADPNTGAYVACSALPDCTGTAPHAEFGGTSLSAPLWAGMAAVWNEANSTASPQQPALGFVAPLLYSLANDSIAYPQDFHDVTSGNNGFAAGTEWDQVTGWGSPNLGELIATVVPVVTTGAASSITQIGASVTGTVNAEGLDTKAHFDYGTTTSYGSVLPTSDMGTSHGASQINGSFPALQPDTTYHYRLEATSADGTAYGSDATFTTLADPATHLSLSASPTTQTAGSAVSLTVNALGSQGDVDNTYRGTIHFTSTDSAATLPANYTFTSADAGTHTFSVTPNTAGTVSITATDTVTASITGATSVTVSAPPPVNTGGGSGGGGGGGGAADAAVSLSGPTTPSTVGTGFPFYITVTNSGGGADEMVLTLNLTGFIYEGYQAPYGPGCSASGSTVTCPISGFISSQQVIVFLQISSLPASVQASVYASGDTDLANNDATWTPVTAPPPAPAPAPAPSPVASSGGTTGSAARAPASSVAAVVSAATVKPVVLSSTTPSIALTVEVSKKTTLTLTLLGANGKVLARWRQGAKPGTAKLTLKLPPGARHPGKDTIRIAAGTSKPKTIPLTIKR